MAHKRVYTWRLFNDAYSRIENIDRQRNNTHGSAFIFVAWTHLRALTEFGNSLPHEYDENNNNNKANKKKKKTKYKRQ